MEGGVKLCEYIHSTGKRCNKPVQYYQNLMNNKENILYTKEDNIYRFCKRHKVSGPLAELITKK